jgi:endonuclease YncB( thermonuclease family)
VRAALLAAAVLLLAPAPATAAGSGVLEGRVVGVVDGDTLDLLVDGAELRVRVAAIDTPERGQPFASRARQALARRVLHREVRIIAVATDVWGRTVGEVYADDVCVGCELVRDGFAWAYRGRGEDRVMLELEREARAARRGIWSLPETQRIPPWEWRAEEAAARAARTWEAPARAARTPEPGCDPPPSCRELTSCEEARRLLAECGHEGLDGDGDGIPCESLCRGP